MFTMFPANDDPFSNCSEMNGSGQAGTPSQVVGANDVEESETVAHDFNQPQTEEDLDTGK